MVEVIVSSEAEFDKAVKDNEAKGLRVAAVSNAGLKSPQKRITFLPASAFTK